MPNLNVYRIAAASVFTLAIALAGSARAQPGPAPSPFAPGDLKRPLFDTQTPVYGSADQEAKAAATVVAEVDGRAVTLGDVGDAVRRLPANVAALPFADLYPGIVSQLVRQEALAIRAQRQGLDEDPAVRRQLRAASEQVLADILLRREISGKITEQALLDRYNRDIAGKPGPIEVHLRVIKVATEQEAAALIAELRAGADFAALARRSSLDPTAQTGGDAGYAIRERLIEGIGAVAFSMVPGQFTPFPVRASDSWFVLKVEDRRIAPVRPFGLMREEILQTLLREGVPDVVSAAMADVVVRTYDVTGSEMDRSSATGNDVKK
jgi:peptidyl-prolyl cis-trans isomerase C